ncbi:tyrosine-type recombinase/integrase [Pelagibacterium xiamenense]|uniref:tyrosine-type recombinase/integrase n=1 Tax=Pelagibacterium xiamenense TaxID=2901140 RepID=UPI001E4F34A8|nr:site-specific integrase [Pelagibacterium xiamenense]MCD7059126.1 site-specific integrase [Pelagibacterium xiamenense]
MKLTPKTVEHLKAGDNRRREVWDLTLPAFGLRVYPSGRKSFFVMVRVRGEQKRKTIGTYPVVSLREARERAREIIRDAQFGILDEEPEEQTLTFDETVPMFIKLYAKPRNRGWKETERILLDKFQALSNKPLDQIRRADVVRILDDLIASGTPYRANRALSAIKKLFAWALDRGMVDVHPVAGLSPLHTEAARERVLTDTELEALMDAADTEGYPFGDLFKVLALTGQRRGEVSGMRWSEIDLERAIWTIPSARSKNKQSHDVPLAPQVVAILKSVPRFLGSDFVFTTTGRTPISGFGRAKDRIDDAVGASDWRTHDLRRTVASGMARMSIPPHVVEKVLNHKSGVISGVAAIYNRYGYEKEKRKALETWADYVEALAHASEAPVNDGPVDQGLIESA